MCFYYRYHSSSNLLELYALKCDRMEVTLMYPVGCILSTAAILCRSPVFNLPPTSTHTLVLADMHSTSCAPPPLHIHRHSQAHTFMLVHTLHTRARTQTAVVISARESLLSQLPSRLRASGEPRMFFLRKIVLSEQAILDGEDAGALLAVDTPADTLDNQTRRCDCVPSIVMDSALVCQLLCWICIRNSRSFVPRKHASNYIVRCVLSSLARSFQVSLAILVSSFTGVIATALYALSPLHFYSTPRLAAATLACVECCSKLLQSFGDVATYDQRVYLEKLQVIV